MVDPENTSSDGDSDDAREGFLEDDGSVEMLMSYAACTIQRQWQHYRRRKKAEVRDLCCSCYTPIHRSCERGLDRPDPVALFCDSCKSKLRHGTPGKSSPASSVLPSPLPRLSLLVQTEAKYQEQLRLLCQQQELLRRQHEEIAARKTLEAESAALERRLARQRRKQFQQLMAKKKEEESRRFQEIESVKIDEASDSKDEQTRSRGKRKPRTAPGGQKHLGALLDPARMRQYRIPAPKARVTEDTASKAAAIAEKAAIEYRRKQKLEMRVQCYAQDLTPLVNGCKPKKLPAPVQLPTFPVSKKKLSVVKPKISNMPRKIIQLEPIHPSNPKQINNQSESSAEMHGEDRKRFVFEPSMSTKQTSSLPLTAEIKPASWMYDLITSDPVLRSHSAISLSSTPTKIHINSKTQLTTLHEVEGDGDDMSSRSDFNHSQRTPLPPSNISHPLATTAESYTSERLASLLQKYNVSITKTAVS